MSRELAPLFLGGTLNPRMPAYLLLTGTGTWADSRNCTWLLTIVKPVRNHTHTHTFTFITCCPVSTFNQNHFELNTYNNPPRQYRPACMYMQDRKETPEAAAGRRGLGLGLGLGLIR